MHNHTIVSNSSIQQHIILMRTATTWRRDGPRGGDGPELTRADAWFDFTIHVLCSLYILTVFRGTSLNTTTTSESLSSRVTVPEPGAAAVEL